MPPSPQPFAFAGSLQLAADQSLPQDPIPFNFSGQFVSLQESVLNLVGTGTQAVPFGSLVALGAKGLLIRYDSGQSGAQPVLCTINAGTQPVEISPGGFLALFNPAPAVGVLSVSVAFTAPCQLRIWVLG